MNRAFAGRLREARKQQFDTQLDFCTEFKRVTGVGMSQADISALERGSVSVKLQTAYELAEFLGYSLDEMTRR